MAAENFSETGIFVRTVRISLERFARVRTRV